MISILKKSATFIVTAFLASAISCYAEDLGPVRFAQEFVGVCVQDFPAVDKIQAAARVLNWKEITDPNMRTMMGPASPEASWQGWLVIEKEDKYFVGISEGELKGQKVSSCTIVEDQVDVESTISELTRILKASKIDETEDAGQRHMIWEFEKDDEHFLLMTGDGTPMKMMMLTASVMTDFRGTK